MTYKRYEVTRSVKLNKYPKYDTYLLYRIRDIRQKSLDHAIMVNARGGSINDVEVSVCQVLCSQSLLLLSDGPKRIN